MHTTLSDGSDTFEEVVEQARERGIGHIAFTNHDTTCGLDEAGAAGARLGVEVTGGIEVSAYDFARGRKVHVLGYGVGEHAPALAACAAPCSIGAGRIPLWQLDRLVEAGYAVDVDRALRVGAGVHLPVQAAPDGRAHGRSPCKRGIPQPVPQPVQGRAASATATSTTWTRATRCAPSRRTAGGPSWLTRVSWTATMQCPNWWHAALRASRRTIRPRPRDHARCRELADRYGLVCTQGIRLSRPVRRRSLLGYSLPASSRPIGSRTSCNGPGCCRHSACCTGSA